MGLSRKRAVQAVHMLALIVGLSVLPLLWGDERTALVIVTQALLMMLLVTFLQYAAKPEAEDENDLTLKSGPGTGGGKGMQKTIDKGRAGFAQGTLCRPGAQIHLRTDQGFI